MAAHIAKMAIVDGGEVNGKRGAEKRFFLLQRNEERDKRKREEAVKKMREKEDNEKEASDPRSYQDPTFLAQSKREAEKERLTLSFYEVGFRRILNRRGFGTVSLANASWDMANQLCRTAVLVTYNLHQTNLLNPTCVFSPFLLGSIYHMGSSILLSRSPISRLPTPRSHLPIIFSFPVPFFSSLKKTKTNSSLSCTCTAIS